MKVAAKLLGEVERAAPDHVATDCPLSALRIEEGTGRKAVHPIVLLRAAYGMGEP
jgi:Fe-S oxidoreductase